MYVQLNKNEHTRTLKTLVFLSTFLCVSAQFLRNEGDIARAVRKASQSNNVGKLMTGLTEDSKNDVASRAEQALRRNLVEDADQGYNVSSTCLNHTEILLMTLASGQSSDWALRSK